MGEISLAEFSSRFGFQGAYEGSFQKVSFDSRQVKQGDLFFALKGEKTDGHEYLEKAAEKGVVGAVVDKSYQGSSFGLPLFAVENVLSFLQEFARSELLRRRCKVVGVTGSVGKTTTKEFIYALLDGSFQVAKNPGSNNSQVTLPATILNSNGSEEILILEMGMSQPGEMRNLVYIAPPDLSVITKIGRAHAQFFSDGIEGIACEKGEILAHPKTQKALIQADAMRFSSVAERGSCEKVLFGKEGADYQLIKQDDLYQIQERGTVSPLFSLPFAADHMCDNFLVAAAVARSFGVSWELIIERAQKIAPFSRRFETVKKGGVTFVNDCYNASAESTKAALKSLPRAKGKTIFVFGEMRELGRYAEESHREVGEAALGCVDHLLCLGEGCRPAVELFQGASKPVEVSSSFAELKLSLERLLQEGDVVLIKGSNSDQLWRILE